MLANTGYDRDGYYMSIYPPPPSKSKSCFVNKEYDTLPVCYPYRDTILGPTSLKHLYRGPNNYPLQMTRVPDDTLYGHDWSTRGAYGERRSYTKMLFPYHHRSPKEVREYSPDILPYPALQQWTTYKTVEP